MSHRKCFYCETELTESSETVDHYVRVADNPELAFEWENLYLCCQGCQRKVESIKPEATIDPCGSVEPRDHLRFENEHLRARDASKRGQSTINRYNLNRQELLYLRTRTLQRWYKLFTDLLKKNGGALSEAQQGRLRDHATSDREFSLMLREVVQRERL